MLVDKAVFRK